MPNWFPSHYAYALARACPQCKAAPGQPCTAPRRVAEHTDPLNRLHLARQDAGMRHYHRDVGSAPDERGRVPGRQYGTLGSQTAPQRGSG
ncbi:zinc finger domain-containing protein [Streptomyces flavidovirens]